MTSVQLEASGERERLKALLRERLVECGWKEDVTRHARGEATLMYVCKSAAAAETRSIHLLHRQLVECGWKQDVTCHARGETPTSNIRIFAVADRISTLCMLQSTAGRRTSPATLVVGPRSSSTISVVLHVCCSSCNQMCIHAPGAAGGVRLDAGPHHLLLQHA